MTRFSSLPSFSRSQNAGPGLLSLAAAVASCRRCQCPRPVWRRRRRNPGERRLGRHRRPAPAWADCRVCGHGVPCLRQRQSDSQSGRGTLQDSLGAPRLPDPLPRYGVRRLPSMPVGSTAAARPWATVPRSGLRQPDLDLQPGDPRPRLTEKFAADHHISCPFASTRRASWPPSQGPTRTWACGDGW